MASPCSVGNFHLDEAFLSNKVIFIERMYIFGQHTRVHTITSDNGKEFAQFQRIGEILEAMMFIAHPYASWERGTNENTNGLIRQYFPKDKDMSSVTREEIEWVERRLNNRPRKCLDFKTPNEVFLGIYSPVALGS